MKGKRPTPNQLAERRMRKKIVNEGFSPINLKDIEAYREWISFSSLTILPINKNSRSTTFIVHTKKPLKWGVFIEKVTEALADSLI